MRPTRPIPTLSALLALCAATLAWAAPLANERYSLEPAADGAVRVTAKGAGTWLFRGDFTVFVAATDPQPAMRPAGIPGVGYNVVTWRTQTPVAGKAKLKTVKRSTGQAGDGFDDHILDGDTKQRTPDLFASAPATRIVATAAVLEGAGIRFALPDHPDFSLAATLSLPAGDAEPVLAYTLTPRRPAWYSVGYTGAPAFSLAEASEIWQPFLWQEKRFPHLSFITAAFQCSLPTAFVRRGGTTLGVVVDAAEFPFSPLPLLDNSRFGIALRNAAGEAQPMTFAPFLGGPGSKRAAGEAFAFRLRLLVWPGDVTAAYEAGARRLYGFRDHRRNAIASLNETLDNMIDYGMSDYSWFVEELKGCAYSTDVPGAVKNVSSLNPLNIALVTDDEEIFRRRAYPIVEYMLSREKFLFCLDPKQKIQSPSRLLRGPCAPVSELATLYGITHGASPILRRLAVEMLGKNRTLNLDDVAEGGTWQNQLSVWSETRDARLLEAARRGADAYLAARMAKPAESFDKGSFFWPGFTPKWIDLLLLHEATGEKRYLEAARQGARQYTLFTWMAPRIPEEDVTVNPGGKVPIYGYLKNKGHLPMSAPEERVPAWRLSEIGLTPESCGTMSGHRAIFMANYAPWMLRIAALTGDTLLHDVARSAVVGRYRNFPGYHINTARTTIYEKADYPLRKHKELSVNSFHYNHIWPHMSILLDYLVNDAHARSGGLIDFPSHFIEGYAYLQSRFIGDRPGRFYQRDDAVLWMPRRLVRTASVELNTLVARGAGRLYLACSNQSQEDVTTELTLNPSVIGAVSGNTYAVRVVSPTGKATELKNGRLTITVPAGGLTALEVEGLAVKPKFQDRLVGAKASDAWSTDYLELPWGGARAMILNFGAAASTAFLYLQDDDSKYKEVSLTYRIGNSGAETTVTDAAYPFEFTVPLPADATSFRFRFSGKGVDGATNASTHAELRK